MLTRNLYMLLLCIVAVESFSPQSYYSTQSVSQIVKENQRFAPLAMDDGNDDAAAQGLMVEDVLEDDADKDDYIVSVGELESDDDQDVGMEDDGQLPGWAIAAQRIQEAREQYRRHETDTGSPEYQVAGMTERINYLTKHLQLHPKDFSTRRGLVALVNKRRRLLNYLAREDVPRYKELISSLGIRHKAPGLVPSREEPYQRFPRQKAIKKHLVQKKTVSK